MTDFDLFLSLLPKILIATVCGMLVGWEREVKNKVAGIRTHVLVCVGAATFTSIGYLLGDGSDPSRVVAQIITGIGFLGGGVIYKHEDKLLGVTSAAFIWFMASVGVLIGLGYFVTSIIMTIGLLIMLIILEQLEHKIK